MKKKILLFIFLFCAILNFRPERVNAEYDYTNEGGLCVYEGKTSYYPGAVSNALHFITSYYTAFMSDLDSLKGVDHNQVLVIRATNQDDVFQIDITYNWMRANPLNQNNMYSTITGKMTGFTAYDYHDKESSDSKEKNIKVSYTKYAKNELADGGECPKKILVKSKNSLGNQIIEELLFIKNQSDVNWTTNFTFALWADKYSTTYFLTKSRFGDKETFKSYTESKCMTDTEAIYYRDMFKDLEKYPNNYAYISIYKANKMDKIASSIITKYSEGSQCYNDNPGNQANYRAAVEHARNALAIMNKKAPDTKKYKNECEYILGSKNEKGSFAYYLDITFRFIKFLAPLLLIVLTMVEYIKVIAANDAELINKTNKRTVTRLIFTLLIFMLPTIINTILSLFGLTGDC